MHVMKNYAWISEKFLHQNKFILNSIFHEPFEMLSILELTIDAKSLKHLL